MSCTHTHTHTHAIRSRETTHGEHIRKLAGKEPIMLLHVGGGKEINSTFGNFLWGKLLPVQCNLFVLEYTSESIS
jgi:hypothetical protein